MTSLRVGVLKTSPEFSDMQRMEDYCNWLLDLGHYELTMIRLD